MAADEFVNAIETLPTTLLDRQQSMKALTSKLIGRAPSAASALHAGEPPSVGSAREAALGTPAEAAAAASAEPPCAAEAAETTEAAETAEAAEAAEAAEEAEVTELIEMISRTSVLSSRRPVHRSGRRRRLSGERQREERGGGGPKAADIGPGWNSTPHRNRPRSLKGLNSMTDEPWKASEELNFGRDAHIEWTAQHKNLYRSGVRPLAAESVRDIEASASKKSELMGNRLLTRQARQAAVKQRAELAALRAARRAEEAALAAELERMRKRWEDELRREAQAEDAAVAAAVREEQRRRVAEAAAAAEAAEAALRAEADEAERVKLRELAESKAEAATRARAGKEEEAAERARAAAARSAQKGIKLKPKGAKFKPSASIDTPDGTPKLTPKSAKKRKEEFLHRSVASQRMSQKHGSRANA